MVCLEGAKAVNLKLSKLSQLNITSQEQFSIFWQVLLGDSIFLVIKALNRSQIRQFSSLISDLANRTFSQILSVSLLPQLNLSPGIGIGLFNHSFLTLQPKCLCSSLSKSPGLGLGVAVQLVRNDLGFLGFLWVLTKVSFFVPFLCNICTLQEGGGRMTPWGHLALSELLSSGGDQEAVVATKAPNC